MVEAIEGIAYQTIDEEGFPLYVVQGNKATLPEYNVAVALHKLGYEFIYEAQFLGGRGAAGGIEVDFLIYTVPTQTPLWIHGEYWHGGEQRSRDLMQMIRLDQAMGGELAPGIELFEDDLPTVEAAMSLLREKVF